MKLNLCVAAAMLWVAPCIAGSSAKNDFDPEVDFSRFKTFSFIGGHELEESGILRDPAVRDRFKNFISGALETRGLREVPIDEKYSLAVRYWVALRKKQDVTIVDTMPAWGPYRLLDRRLGLFIPGVRGRGLRSGHCRRRSYRPRNEGTCVADFPDAEDQ